MAWWEGQPRFAHDCEDCIFLGMEGAHDLWAHSRPSSVDLIRRYSGRNDDYGCMPWVPGEAPHPVYRRVLGRYLIDSLRTARYSRTVNSPQMDLLEQIINFFGDPENEQESL